MSLKLYRFIRFKEGASGAVRIEIDGKEFAPEEISARILQKLKQAAESFLGETVSEAVDYGSRVFQ